MLSLGVSREFARTGAIGGIGAALDNDDTSSTTPTIFWGKGFGDLPIGFLRPLALTGTLGYTFADKKLKVIGADPDSGDPLFNNGISNQWSGGLSLQYSMRYLQTQVKDLGLPEFVNRLTPVVEMAWSSPASSPSQSTTQFLFGVGVNYTADSLCAERRGAHPRQSAVGLACRRDRAVPSLLRRPVPQQSRQADRELVQMMRPAILLVLAMWAMASPASRACASRTRPAAGRQRNRRATAADRADLHRGRGTVVQHDRIARPRRIGGAHEQTAVGCPATTGSLPSICRPWRAVSTR